MKLILDTADISAIRRISEIVPVAGVTTNPTILMKEGGDDMFAHLEKMRKKMDSNQTLFVQTVSTTAEEIVEEALKIRERIHGQLSVKIPASLEGVRAITCLKNHPKPVSVTATAIYTPFQGMLASMAGSDYLAVYYNRMENAGVDASRALESLMKTKGKAELLVASFHSIRQVVDAYTIGAEYCTVAPSLILKCLNDPDIEKAVEQFQTDFRSCYHASSILEIN